MNTTTNDDKPIEPLTNNLTSIDLLNEKIPDRIQAVPSKFSVNSLIFSALALLMVGAGVITFWNSATQTGGDLNDNVVFTSDDVDNNFNWVEDGGDYGNSVRADQVPGVIHVSHNNSERAFFSIAADSLVGMVVSTPTDYNPTSQESYPVIYYFHDGTGNEFEYMDVMNMVNPARKSELDIFGLFAREDDSLAENSIIVFVNAGKHTGYINSSVANIETMLMEEVRNFVSENYNITNSESIVGFGDGALGAILYGAKYPDRFEHVVAINPDCTEIKVTDFGSMEAGCDFLKESITNSLNKTAELGNSTEFLILFSGGNQSKINTANEIISAMEQSNISVNFVEAPGIDDDLEEILNFVSLDAKHNSRLIFETLSNLNE